MTITWYGQSCFKIDTREAVLAIDPFSKEIGLPPPRFHADIVLITHHHYDHANAAAILARSPKDTAISLDPSGRDLLRPTAGIPVQDLGTGAKRLGTAREGLGTGEPMVISGPGEYEARNISIRGIPSFHDSRQGHERGANTIYRIVAEGMSLAHLGDFGESAMREETVEALGDIDILLIPVGGTYTINGEAATKLIRQIEPRLVIPMHYLLPGLKVKLAPVEDFLKSYGVPRAERLDKISIKKKDLPETETRVVILSKI